MNNEKKCLGCGIPLQDENVLLEGYTTSLDNDLCQRCFRMKNYGDYQTVTKSNQEYLDILKAVGNTKDLVLYITDLLNLEENLAEVRKILPNKMILVLNKKDVFPKSVKEEKLIKYISSLENVNFEEIIVISAEKNYNITIGDYIRENYKRIKLYQNSFHPNKCIIWEYNKRLLKELNIKCANIDELVDNSPEHIHQGGDVPIYPSVAYRLGLEFVDEKTKYEVMIGNRVEYMTFREYVEHYVEYTRRAMEIMQMW